MKIMFCGKSINKLRFLVVVILALSVFIAILIAVLGRFKPIFIEKASHSAKTQAIDIINKATDDVFFDVSSLDFVIINQDNEGKITSVNADTIEMNRLKTKLSKSIQEQAKATEQSLIYIPIGSLTNIAVLQGVGYRIPVKVSTDGFAKIDFGDEFISCGINQVKHKIFMTVSVRVSVISSVFTKTETVTTQIPVAETVLSGTVPNYYGANMSILGR